MQMMRKILSQSLKNNWMWIACGVVLLFADLFTKWLARNFLPEPIHILGNLLQLSLSYNPGIAFSIPIPNVVMMILTPIILGLVAWVISQTCDLKQTITKLCLILIFTGGFGNLINRIWTGAVIDMISFSFWPSFNLADSYLTIGAFLIILFYGRISLSSQ